MRTVIRSIPRLAEGGYGTGGTGTFVIEGGVLFCLGPLFRHLIYLMPSRVLWYFI